MIRSVRKMVKLGLVLLAFNAAAAEFDARIGAPASSPKLFRVSSEGGCRKVENLKPNRYCSLELPVDFAFRPDLVLEFDYRNLVAPGVKLSYTAVALTDGAKNATFQALPVSAEWKHARVALGTQRFQQNKMRIAAGTPITGLQLYSRGEEAAGITAALEVRDLRFTLDPAYDPAAGLRVSYSALPLFDWPARPSGKYRIEISPNPAFPLGKTMTKELRVPFFVPDAPLGPGITYYRVADGATGEVCAADALVVPSLSQDWRLPAYDFAAFTARPRPRLKALAEYYHPDPAVIVRQAEAVLDYPIPPNPEPYREGADPAITAWIDWYNKVGNGVITATGRRMAAVGQAALLTDRADLKAKAREWVLEVGRHWDPESGTHARRHDLAVSNLLRGMAWCFDAAYDIMTPEEREVAASGIRRRGEQYWEWLHPFLGEEANNHPWDQAQAAAVAILSLPEEPQAEMRFRFLCDLFAYRFLPALGFEGENNEGLGYWSYGTGLLVRFVELSKYAVGVDLFQHPWLRQTARFPLYSAPDAGFGISFGDTGSPNHGLTGPVNRAFVAKLAAAAGDRAALWYAGVPEDGKIKAKIPLGMPQSKFYPHLGIAFFNTFLPDGRENVAVGFHSGHYYAGHQHPDQNGFVINAYGDKLAIDGGYCDWYNSPHFKAYSARTVAHNTILIDGRGQAFHTFGADGKVTAYFDSTAFGYVAGNAAHPKIYNGALSRFDRELLFVKPDLIFVFDRLAAPKPITASWLIHAQSEKPIEVAGNTFAIDRPRARLDGVMLLPCKVKMEVTKAYQVGPNRVASTELESNPEPEWLLAAANIEPAERLEFLAALEIRRREEAGRAPQRWQLVDTSDANLVKGTGVLVLFNRHPGKPVELGGLATDAAVAALRLGSDGKVTAATFINGTRLTFGPQQWTLPAPGNFATPAEPVAAKPARFRFDGKDLPATLHTTSAPNRIFTLEGTVASPDFRELTFHMAPAPLPRQIRVANAASRTISAIPAGQNEISGILLPPGRSLFSITSASPLNELEVTSSPVQYRRTERLAPSFTPPAVSIPVEAEAFHRADRTVTVLSRPDASGDKLIRGWNTEGLALEWEFPVAKAGRYELIFRLAAEAEPVRVRLSGSGFAAPVIADFGATGGTGFRAAEYRSFRLPVPIELPAGAAVLKLKVLQGAPNWDRLDLAPVR